MNILAVDDEPHALARLKHAIQKAAPDCRLYASAMSAEALKLAEEDRIDVAFLDVRIDEMSGLEVAKRLKEINEQVNIIFVTGYDEYMGDAWRMRASGYLEKPVTAEDVYTELHDLRRTLTVSRDKGLWVQAFGNFEVFLDGCPLHFGRSKSKEIFAYLIHRRGASCSLKELTAVIYEERPYSNSLERQMQTYISAMIKTLKDGHVEDCIIRRYNEISVNIKKINCDYYQFLDGNPEAVIQYAGEYMTGYSWAETMVGVLDQKLF